MSVGGVVVDDARLLRDGDHVIVRVPSEELVKDVPAPLPSPCPKDQRSGPREVTVSFVLLNIKEIDAIAHSVYMDFQIYLTWKEPQIVGVPVDQRPPYNEELRGDDTRPCLWNPKVEVNNDLNLEILWAVFPAQHQGVEEGIIRWGARYRGNVSNGMDLHQFPFDADVVSIVIGPKDATITDCVLVIDTAKHGFEGAVGDRIKESTLDEWDLGQVSVTTKASLPTGSGNIYSNCEYGLVVYRRVSYYAYKVILMKMIIIVSCFSVFFQDPLEDFADRQAHTFTLALAAVAFLYVANQDLPKVSYLTIMDKFLLLGFLVLFVAGLENWAVFVIAKHYRNAELARQIDLFVGTVLAATYFVSTMVMVCMGLYLRAKTRSSQAKKTTEKKEKAEEKKEEKYDEKKEEKKLESQAKQELLKHISTNEKE
jgi:hypothetical protein